MFKIKNKAFTPLEAGRPKVAVATTSAFAEVAIIKLFLVGFIKDMDMVY